MKDLLGKAAPAMDEPLEILSACHERVHAQLLTLQRLSEWLPEHGADDQAQLAAHSIMRYFDVAAVNHHLDEEKDLLPAMQAASSGADLTQVTELRDWVLEDHRRLFEKWVDMRARLSTIAEGRNTTLTCEQVRSFVNAYVEHIEREEDQLLPLATRLLGPDVLSGISHSMTARRRTDGQSS